MTPAEKSLSYADKLEMLESLLLILQSDTSIQYKQEVDGICIKIANAKLERDTIVPVVM